MNSDRRCIWCGETPATREGMTFERKDRNCPCSFCKLLLSKRRNGSVSSTQGQPIYVRRRIVNRRHSTDNLD
jgi:hypothetical protein